ncbi:MAG TPA: glycosyltransferase, partial [Candidatus Limnocylindrales bacterium]|nr:glycosyltransferase [Candidatus Limnocylindrales bacterium]
ISVVVCTLNRADSLRATLQSLSAQQLSSEAFETIVVDNGSSDATRAVAEEFAAAAGVRYLLEPVLGLCHARNAGWRVARGQYVAYLDDDALAEPSWLAELLATFGRVQPTPGCVGGRVDPLYEAPRPSWLSDEIALSLTIIDWPNGPHAIADLRQEWLVGANLAFPRAVLEQVGGFHPALDRAGNNLLSSGDVYLQRLILDAGYSCYYQPGARVQHRVPAARLERRWFVRRYYWQGVSDAVMEILHERPSRAARRRAALRRAAGLLASPRQLAWLILRTRDPRRFTQKCWALISVGYAVGLLRARA